MQKSIGMKPDASVVGISLGLSWSGIFMGEPRNPALSSYRLNETWFAGMDLVPVCSGSDTV